MQIDHPPDRDECMLHRSWPRTSNIDEPRTKWYLRVDSSTMFGPSPAGQLEGDWPLHSHDHCCLDNHGVDLNLVSRVCGVVILLDWAKLGLQGLDNPPKVWSVSAIVGDHDLGVGAILLSSIGVEHCLSILISLIHI